MIKKSLLRWAVVSNNNVYNRLPVCPPSYILSFNRQYPFQHQISKDILFQCSLHLCLSITAPILRYRTML
jgi:hypothetical protein